MSRKVIIFDRDDGGDDNCETRTSREIRERAVVLFALSRTAYETSCHEIRKWLVQQDLGSAISSDEDRVFRSNKPSKKDRINASWRVETLEALLWSLDEVPDFSPPTAACDVERVNRVFSFFLLDSGEFLKSERMRPEDDISDQREAVLELHWKIRDARIHGRPIPDGLIPGVVQEKHYALNWILDGEDWDDVLTDT